MAEYLDLTELEPGCVIYRRAGGKKGAWHMRLTVPGGYIRKSTRTAEKRRAMRLAREEWQRTARRVDAGKTVSLVPFEKVAAEFLAYVEKAERFEGSRRSAHRQNVKRHLLPCLCGKPIDAIFDRDIQKLIRSMEERGAAASSINNTLTSLRILFKFATQEFIDKSDVPAIENVSLERQEARPTFTEEEVDAILKKLVSALGAAIDAAKGDDLSEIMRDPAVRRAHELFHFVNLIAATGMRPSSIGRLRVADVRVLDSAACKAVIRTETKKGGRTRRWDIVPRRQGADNILLLVEGAEPSDPMFSLKPNYLSRLFTAFLEDEGKDLATDAHGRRRTIYSLRHFYITHMLERGVPLSIVAKNAMTSLQMIQRYYEHISVRKHHDELALTHEVVEHKDIPDSAVLVDS